MGALRFGRKNKFGVIPTGGFPSKHEASVYYMLLLREKAGQIKNIQRQQTVILQDGPREVQIKWRLDFSYELCETDEKVYVEAKGFETEDYKLKLKLWRKNPPFKLEIYKSRNKIPYLAEVVEIDRALAD